MGRKQCVGSIVPTKTGSAGIAMAWLANSTALAATSNNVRGFTRMIILSLIETTDDAFLGPCPQSEIHNTTGSRLINQ